MTEDEAKKCVKLLVGLFPAQMTPEQFRNAVVEFRAFEIANAQEAIKVHRASHEFITWPQLFEGCRAVSAAKGEGAARNEGSWCDIYRRQVPQLQGLPDVEVVLRIHRGWWFKCSKSDGYRRHFEHSCTSQLIVAGMKPEDAPQWAATVFEESVEYFRQVLDELRAAAAPAQEPCPV